MKNKIIIDGVTWYLYTSSYTYLGESYEINFYAENDKDAEFRIEAIKSSLKLDGRVIANGNMDDIRNN